MVRASLLTCLVALALAPACGDESTTGQPMGEGNVGGDAGASAAFGGADYKTLFVTTNSDGWFKIPMAVPGLPRGACFEQPPSELARHGSPSASGPSTWCSQCQSGRRCRSGGTCEVKSERVSGGLGTESWLVVRRRDLKRAKVQWSSSNEESS